MLDERLDDSDSNRIPNMLVGLSAGGALFTILLAAISFLHRRKAVAGIRGGTP